MLSSLLLLMIMIPLGSLARSRGLLPFFFSGFWYSFFYNIFLLPFVVSCSICDLCLYLVLLTPHRSRSISSHIHIFNTSRIIIIFIAHSQSTLPFDGCTSHCKKKHGSSDSMQIIPSTSITPFSISNPPNYTISPSGSGTHGLFWISIRIVSSDILLQVFDDTRVL